MVFLFIFALIIGFSIGAIVSGKVSETHYKKQAERYKEKLAEYEAFVANTQTQQEEAKRILASISANYDQQTTPAPGTASTGEKPNPGKLPEVQDFGLVDNDYN